MEMPRNWFLLWVILRVANCAYNSRQLGGPRYGRIPDERANDSSSRQCSGNVQKVSGKGQQVSSSHQQTIGKSQQVSSSRQPVSGRGQQVSSGAHGRGVAASNSQQLPRMRPGTASFSVSKASSSDGSSYSGGRSASIARRYGMNACGSDSISGGSDSVSRQSDSVSRQSDSVSRQSNSVSRQSDSVSRQSDSVSRQSDSVSRQSGGVSRQSDSLGTRSSLKFLDNVEIDDFNAESSVGCTYRDTDTESQTGNLTSVFHDVRLEDRLFSSSDIGSDDEVRTGKVTPRQKEQRLRDERRKAAETERRRLEKDKRERAAWGLVPICKSGEKRNAPSPARSSSISSSNGLAIKRHR